MKRIICAMLTAALLCAALTGCAGQSGQTAFTETPAEKPCLVGNIPVSFPLTNGPQSMNIMITAAGGRDQEGVHVWQKYEDMTGVDVNWTEVTKDTRSEMVHAALTNHQQYDLIMRCKISATKQLSYGKSGLILDLAKDGMLQKYAPNCWAYLQAHPDTLASVMNPDGSIYALPQVNSGAELRVAQKMYINKQWLERVNLEPPTTIEQMREMLIAFKEQDANGNGDPSDEIPMCALWGSVSMALYGSYGLANRGFHNETVDCDPEMGRVRLIAGCEEYREFLEFLHGLYEDGLIDKNLFTVTLDQMAADAAMDKVGVLINTNLALLPVDIVDNWVAVDEALTGPNEDKLWSAIRANFHSTGARSLDEWDAYTEKLQELGAEDMLDTYQAAVDRYHALITALN